MVRKNRKIRLRKARKNPIITVLKWSLLLCLVVFTGVAGVGYYYYSNPDELQRVGLWATRVYYERHFNESFPDIDFMKDYRPPIITTVYADDERKIGEFYKERRILTPYDKIPKDLVHAFLSAEDSRFFEHPGVDLKSIARAALKNYEAGTVVQGGSTITQQVIKSFFLTPERSYERKIKEAILAYHIDHEMSKEEILYLYLNHIYLGNGAYGVAAAGENYFNKSLNEMTLGEFAMLAGLPQAPSDYSPLKNFGKARERQRYVLDRMVIDGHITQAAADKAYSADILLAERPNWFIENVPYYTEHVRQYVAEKYGEEMLYQGGLKIYTAVNVPFQKAAHKAIERGLRELDKRHFGYRGPVRHLDAKARAAWLAEAKKARETSPLVEDALVQGLVTEVDEKKRRVEVDLGGGKGFIRFDGMQWALKKAERKADSGKYRDLLSSGDLIEVRLADRKKDATEWDLRLEQPPKTQSALICMETGTGRVKAMVGGRGFEKSQFNRAIQSKRQPGSAFKPIVYAAALDKGYTPATEVNDNPFVTRKWKPKNYDRRFHGQVLLRKALAKSMNLPTINILDDIGVDYAVDYAHKLGIESDLARNMSIALGSSGLSPLELVSAYSVFANGGELVEPVFVEKIVDRDGNVLEEASVEKKRVIEETTAYLVTSLLESVVQIGTGRRVRALDRPAAGKTGTTNDIMDAWFVGFTPDYITGAWVGYDRLQTLGRGESGGRAAIPIWLEFMQAAHEGLPKKSFKTPRGIVSARIDAETGLLPTADSKNVIFEIFKQGTVPEQKSRSSTSVTHADQLFKDM